MKLNKKVQGNKGQDNPLKPKFPPIRLNKDEYTVYCFTDGACEGNGKEENRGGYAYIFVDADDVSCGTQFQVSAVNTSNNKMELRAVIDALKWIKQHLPLTQVLIHIDSQYVVHGLGTWYKGWIARNWVEVKNKELWQELLALKNELPKVQYKWVAAHQENPLKKKAYHQNSEFETKWNAYVDQLAVEACTGIRQEDKTVVTKQDMQSMVQRGEEQLKGLPEAWLPNGPRDNTGLKPKLTIPVQEERPLEIECRWTDEDMRKAFEVFRYRGFPHNEPEFEQWLEEYKNKEQ